MKVLAHKYLLKTHIYPSSLIQIITAWMTLVSCISATINGPHLSFEKIPRPTIQDDQLILEESLEEEKVPFYLTNIVLTLYLSLFCAYVSEDRILLHRCTDLIFDLLKEAYDIKLDFTLNDSI